MLKQSMEICIKYAWQSIPSVLVKTHFRRCCCETTNARCRCASPQNIDEYKIVHGRVFHGTHSARVQLLRDIAKCAGTAAQRQGVP